MGLSLPAVAAHQQAVRVLPARIPFDDAVAQARAGRVSPEAEVQTAQTAECIEMGKAQAFAGKRCPILVRVIRQKVTAVESIRELILPRRLVDFPCVFKAAA